MHDQDGFRDFVSSRGAALSRSAFLLTGDHQLAEDLLQTVLTRCAGHWHRIADGDPEAYARRAMINERTSRWRRHRYTVEVPLTPEVVTTAGSAVVADVAEHVVRRRAIVRALARLPARQRAVIVLRFFDDLSESATAAALGCSIGTVKSQTHAALKRLRSLAPQLLSEHSAGTGDPDPLHDPAPLARPEVTW